jgi:hypothetical protein
MMKTIIECIIRGSMGVSALFLCSAAGATPEPLPFTYPYETLAKGEAEDEMYGDVTPLRVYADPADPTKGRLWEPYYQLQNEIEFGVTDHVELAWYQVFEANPLDGGTNVATFDGMKFRARIRLAEAGELPLDVAFYVELEALHDEWSLEEKVILAKRFARRFHWMANLWVEQEMIRPMDDAQRNVDFVVNPTTGITYEVVPSFQPGIEYWGRGVLGARENAPVDAVNDRLHSFLGPTVHFDWGKLWWSLGVYADLNNVNKPLVGEAYGPVWVRSLLGLTL